MKSPTKSLSKRSLASRFRTAVSEKLEWLAEGLGLVFSVSGASVALVLGKLVVGVVLGVLALGFVGRMMGRKRRTAEPTATPSSPGTAARLLTGLASAIEVAVLVEATNLPVRFDQAGFHMGHWYLVLLAFLAAYFLQLQLFGRWLGRSAS